MVVYKVSKVLSYSVLCRHGFVRIGKVPPLRTPQQPFIGVALIHRGVHTYPITKNIAYISNDKELKADKKTLKLEHRSQRPLCLIMCWLMAKPQHILKYASIYLELGYDVVTIKCSSWQLVFPTTGSQMVAADLMKFLEVNEDRNRLVVHGFSVGAYVWSELLVLALKHLDRYQPVLNRVAAQVWDSPADIDEMPTGMAMALFPKNIFLQKALTSYLKMHMRLLYNVATRHYLRATHVYHNTPCHAPTLFLVSRIDPTGTEKRSRKAHDMMTAAGIKCNWKCWNDSLHVQHYHRYPEEYLAALYSHLDECGLPTKIINTP